MKSEGPQVFGLEGLTWGHPGMESRRTTGEVSREREEVEVRKRRGAGVVKEVLQALKITFKA